MPELKEFLASLRSKHGTQTEVARRIGITSQLLGQYEKGTRNPKLKFYRKWKEVYGEDLQAMMDETNVSRETKKPTSVQNEAAIPEKTPKGEIDYDKTIDGLIALLKDDNHYFKKQNERLQDELKAARDQYDKLVTIALTDSKK